MSEYVTCLVCCRFRLILCQIETTAALDDVNARINKLELERSPSEAFEAISRKVLSNERAEETTEFEELVECSELYRLETENVKSQFGEGVLNAAARQGNLKQVLFPFFDRIEWCVQASKDKHASTSDPAQVQILLRKGCGVNRTSNNGSSPLHHACSHGIICLTLCPDILRRTRRNCSMPAKKRS